MLGVGVGVTDVMDTVAAAFYQLLDLSSIGWCGWEGSSGQYTQFVAVLILPQRYVNKSMGGGYIRKLVA